MKKIMPVIAALGLIAVCVLGFFGYRAARKYIPTKEMADLKSFYGVSGEDTAILYNQELQEARGLYMNGQTYLPISWVNEHINKRFYCWSTPCRTRSFMPMGKPRGPMGNRSFWTGRTASGWPWGWSIIIRTWRSWPLTAGT